MTLNPHNQKHAFIRICFKLSKYQWICLYLLMICNVNSYGQSISECKESFKTQKFDNITSRTEKYGANMNNGFLQELRMTIYFPESDSSQKRPLLIFARGNGGQRSNFENICKTFASMGFVATTIDRRGLINNSSATSSDIIVELIKGIQDMKAAIKYFKNDVKIGNSFKIDTNLVFIGGFSAGAMISILTAYWDVKDMIPSSYNSIVTAQGGLEGQSNNISGVTSKVAGVISQAGGILNTSMIQAGDPPLISLHGSLDPVVPYDDGNLLGVLFLQGSNSIHFKMNQLKIPNFLYTIDGGGHLSVQTTSEHTTYWTGAINLLSDIICTQRSIISTSTNHSYKSDFLKIISNPISEQLEIQYSGINTNTLIQIFDSKGMLVKSDRINIINQDVSTKKIDFSQMAAGVYYLKAVSKNGFTTKKLIKL